MVTELCFAPMSSGPPGPPSTTYLVMADPLAAAGRQEIVAVASPAVAVTPCGLPGTCLTGVGGGVGAGAGGRSAPVPLSSYLLTSLTTCLSATTRADDPSGAVMDKL